jgi:hypothetical protein
MTTCKSLTFPISPILPVHLRSLSVSGHNQVFLFALHKPAFGFSQLYRMHASVARELGDLRNLGQFGAIYVLQ